MKFGYAVTGTIHPDRIFTNAGARPGDVLVLTKPIGTGAINTAVKNGKASESTAAAAIAAMTESAEKPSLAMQKIGANACTDVTGFGLLGHAFEMAKASNITLTIVSKDVPLLPDVLHLISMGMLTRGDKNNREYVGDNIIMDESISPSMQSALFDPQTAGGLLISLTPENAARFIELIPCASIIGSVETRNGRSIEVK
jgi:selenide,water dikinase